MKGALMKHKMIKVDEDVHILLKDQARALGLSLMDYMRTLAYKNKRKV